LFTEPSCDWGFEDKAMKMIGAIVAAELLGVYVDALASIGFAVSEPIASGLTSALRKEISVMVRTREYEGFEKGVGAMGTELNSILILFGEHPIIVSR